MSTIQRLPIDLLTVILTMLLYEDKVYIATVSLVCRDWYSIFKMNEKNIRQKIFFKDMSCMEKAGLATTLCLHKWLNLGALLRIKFGGILSRGYRFNPEYVDDGSDCEDSSENDDRISVKIEPDVQGKVVLELTYYGPYDKIVDSELWGYCGITHLSTEDAERILKYIWNFLDSDGIITSVTKGNRYEPKYHVQGLYEYMTRDIKRKYAQAAVRLELKDKKFKSIMEDKKTTDQLLSYIEFYE
jgi:hypothetical protein